ncbi:MAG TPA: type II secretion system secretin GspD [Povalibacter sp.]|uniref:type II secretion system secretin GspD n=1 Tax=Povalibacter sp. TaxID=1962978 RepID=UPI002C8BDDC6|nr:type II secretion system secretin GspD [Povalibacter sp.]HMN46667.1 type II secretion system secretin GspD [Povalibacter sp.]
MTRPPRDTSRATRKAGPLLCAIAMTLTWSSAQTQQQAQTITPNFKDADLALVVQAVQSITGKTFIIDPRVRAQVTILSSTPMSADAFYDAFLSVLQVHDFVAVPSGNVVKIVPAQNSRWMPGNDLPNQVSPSSDEIVTQVIQVKNINAANLVPALRPLLPQGAHFVAHQSSNTLIISDRAANVNRMIRIIQRIDQAGDEEVEIIRLENASAAEIVRVVNTLYTAAGPQQEGGVAATKVVADDRTNSVLLSGEKNRRLQLRALIAHLDTPLESGGDTQVRYLRYADAEQLAGKLKEQITGIMQATPGAPPVPGGGGSGAAEKGITIWSDTQNNALIVTAPPKIMRSIMSVVDKLDIRRPQVLIEAILVEISTTKASELGVNWAIGNTDSDSTVPIGTWNQPVGNASIGSIAAAIDNPELLATTGLPTGLTLGAGRFLDNGTNFAVILRALRGDGSSNILQTPSITTLDNEEAEIKVAQEVPFVTGQYSSTGTGGNNGSVNPFQTIQREEVGTILKITPQINEGDAVTLKIEQESSDLAPSATASSGAVDLITNKRTINTKVMVEDGGVIVLGGLIRDAAIENESRVPVLGAIPIIGELFKTRSGSKEKRNLMVFIRPTILRDGVKAAIETNAKYNVMRNQQLQRRGGKVNLLPGERQPLLPPIEELSRYADPTAGATPPAADTDETLIQPPVQTAPLPAQPVPETAPPPPNP